MVNSMVPLLHTAKNRWLLYLQGGGTGKLHTPSIAFHHLPPNPARTGYYLHHWRGPLYLHAAVHRCSQHPPKGLGPSKTVLGSNTLPKHSHEHETRPPQVNKNKRFCLSSRDLGLICAGISNTVSYKRNSWYNLRGLSQTSSHLSVTDKLFVSWQFFQDLWHNRLWWWLEEGCHKPVPATSDLPPTHCQTCEWTKKQLLTLHRANCYCVRKHSHDNFFNIFIIKGFSYCTSTPTLDSFAAWKSGFMK